MKTFSMLIMLLFLFSCSNAYENEKPELIETTVDEDLLDDREIKLEGKISGSGGSSGDFQSTGGNDGGGGGNGTGDVPEGRASTGGGNNGGGNGSDIPVGNSASSTGGNNGCGDGGTNPDDYSIQKLDSNEDSGFCVAEEVYTGTEGNGGSDPYGIASTGGSDAGGSTDPYGKRNGSGGTGTPTWTPSNAIVTGTGGDVPPIGRTIINYV